MEDETQAEDVRELWITAPHGFRPSQWVEMLVDYDEAYEVDRYLVDRGYIDHHEILVIAGQIFDPNAPEAENQHACLWEVLGKVSRLGLTLNIHPRFSTDYPELYSSLVAFLANNPAHTEVRTLEQKASATPPQAKAV